MAKHTVPDKVNTELLQATEFNAVKNSVNEAYDELAPLANPTFTGAVTVPTPATSDNSTKAASTAYVVAKIGELIASAPGALDTLDELANALGDDSNFAATVTTALASKAAITYVDTQIAAVNLVQISNDTPFVGS